MSNQIYDGIAGIYDAHRANYPQELITAFAAAVQMSGSAGLVLDVGAGTGIATRQLRAVLPETVAVIGLEPGEDMRRTAVSQSNGLPNLAFLNAPAEELPFSAATVDGILVAQALHWFDRPSFYAEAARVLRPRGVLGIIQNNRRWRASHFLAAYESLLEQYGDNYNRDYRSFDIASELKAAAHLHFIGKQSSPFTLEIPQADFANWSLTSSKTQAVVRNIGEERLRAHLDELVGEYFGADSAVSIAYESELFLARCIER